MTPHHQASMKETITGIQLMVSRQHLNACPGSPFKSDHPGLWPDFSFHNKFGGESPKPGQAPGDQKLRATQKSKPDCKIKALSGELSCTLDSTSTIRGSEEI
jgi:hypothetical protein